MVIIKRKLRGTSFEVTLELDEVQHAHLQLIEGKGPGLHVALDPNVAGEMAALAAHFEGGRGLNRVQVLIEDEARDAAEMVR